VAQELVTGFGSLVLESIKRSVINIRRSMLDVRCSTFDVHFSVNPFVAWETLFLTVINPAPLTVMLTPETSDSLAQQRCS
jgi:hypothetical protein